MNDSPVWFTATLHRRKRRISDPICNDGLKIEQADLLQEILPLYTQSAAAYRLFVEPSLLEMNHLG